jgi:hypothetical protein
MDPNTRVALTELSDEHLEKIVDIYRSVGLAWDQETPIADEVRDELEIRMEAEFRPTMVDISKMLIGQRPFSGKDYVHIYITYNGRANAPNDADKIFDQRIRKEFIP